MKNLSSRFRIVLLVVALALPILGLTLYNGFMQRAAVEAAEQAGMRLIAELTAKRPEQLIQDTHRLLSTMAGHIDSLLRDRHACQSYFNKLLPEGGNTYRAMGVILPNGDLFCNSAIAGLRARINVGDRPYFRTALATGEFTVGEFEVGHAAGQSGINFAYPVRDADQRVVAVIFAGLNLDSLVGQGQSRSEGKVLFRNGRIVTIFDRNGIVLAQYPQNQSVTGKKFSGSRVLENMQTARHGLFIVKDSAGTDIFYVVESVGMNPDGEVPIRVAVGIPAKLMFAEADRTLSRTIIGILLVTLLVIIGAWYGAEKFVLRRFHVLLAMAEKVRGGDFSARTGFEAGQEELARLGNAFDAMAQQLQARDGELQDALRRLNEQAVTDQLTGLPNRRYLWEALGAELMRSRRRGTPLAVLFLDIDHFKKFNDRWGHEAGDLVLKHISYAIRAVVRGSDIVARHGGEEFVIVLSEADEEVALSRAEAVRTTIADLRLTYNGESLGTITASVGVAVSRTLRETPEGMVRVADAAMYEAKQGGRDRVVLKSADVEA